MTFPKALLVRQKFPDNRLHDIPGTVLSELNRTSFGSRLQKGSSVAIGVGSRGIGNIDRIVKPVVDYWLSQGMAPFIFPAMGSHGAATAEGQTAVLAKYGVTEANMGCPIRSSLEVISLGKSPEGIEVFLDKLASEAAGIMLVGRVKAHTDFIGEIESGLFKMMGIGLGKWAGAQNYHMHACHIGLGAVILSVGRQVLGSGKILGGLAIIEDAYHQTSIIEAVPVAGMEARERELLKKAKSLAPSLPFDLDVLTIDEIGKSISGAGMDTKVVNRGVQGDINCFAGVPQIQRIFVRGLHKLSYGNASGIGMADIITDRLANAVDNLATWLNSLTATTPRCAKLPIHFATDRECLERIIPTVGKPNWADVRMGWIANTLELTPLALSENMRAEIEANPLLEIISEPRDLPFNSDGNLADVWFNKHQAAA